LHKRAKLYIKTIDKITVAYYNYLQLNKPLKRKVRSFVRLQRSRTGWEPTARSPPFGSRRARGKAKKNKYRATRRLALKITGLKFPAKLRKFFRTKVAPRILKFVL